MKPDEVLCFRESSFNMTRGDDDIKWGGGGLRKLLDTRKGSSEKIREGLRKFVYFKNQQEIGRGGRGRGGGGLEPLARRAAKFQASSFNFFIPPSSSPPPLVILNELSLRFLFSFLPLTVHKTQYTEKLTNRNVFVT